MEGEARLVQSFTLRLKLRKADGSQGPKLSVKAYQLQASSSFIHRLVILMEKEGSRTPFVCVACR